jgi:hypothetical protein
MLRARNSIRMVMPFAGVSIREIDILLFEKPRTSGCLARGVFSHCAGCCPTAAISKAGRRAPLDQSPALCR